GLRSTVDKIASGESGTIEESHNTYTYDQLMSPTFKLVMPYQRYVWDGNLGVWTDKSDDQSYMNDLIANAPDLHIVGVVQAKDPTTTGALSEGIYYTPQLTQKMISDAEASPIVQDQMNRPDVDVFTGKTFEDEKNGQTSEGLSISSLISVDSNVLSSAFNFNPQALNFSSINLSGLDMSS
ncbi:MAG: ABC transporter, partial [Atopobium sp.]|nr:ABC transporter [Atopobium sp.]